MLKLSRMIPTRLKSLLLYIVRYLASKGKCILRLLIESGQNRTFQNRRIIMIRCRIQERIGAMRASLFALYRRVRQIV